MKKLLFGIATLALLVGGFTSCSDNVDDSNLYVFTGKSITDYVKSEPELSYYYLMLTRARSGKKGSTMDHMLEARGNYTVFAPTNAAVQHYLDSINGTTNYDVNQTPDSVAQDIVFNSIIDCEDQEAFKTTTFIEGTIEYKTMADRFATVNFTTDTAGKVKIMIDAYSAIIVPDNEAENGWMHVVDRVVMPYSSTLSDLIASQDNLRIFSHLLLVTHFSDSLSPIRDEKYEALYKEDTHYAKGAGVTARVPQHRYFGFTAFVEPDSLLCAKWGIELKYEGGGVSNWDEVMKRISEVCKEYYPNSKSEDLTSPDNAVNQFVAYHLVRGAMSYNKLVIHYNEVGYAYTNPYKLGIDKMQYWETMGKYTKLLKMTEGAQTNGKRLNRYVSKYDWDSYDELEVPRPGILVSPNNGPRDIQALNGFYYPIDDILWYDDDVPNKVLNERLRFDWLALQPELMTNGMRALPNNNYYWITSDYCDGISFTDETEMITMEVYAQVGCRAFEQDEPQFNGDYDVTFRLPHVPYSGTYELRVATANGPTRSMMQVYVGTDKYNLSAIGLPIDMRYDETTPRIGYYLDDPYDKEENIRKNRNMRNHDVMKGPNCYGDFSTSGTVGGRNDGFSLHKLRNIVYRGYVDANKTYYLRFKSVLTNPRASFDIDYMEWVPKSVYAGVNAEDFW